MKEKTLEDFFRECMNEGQSVYNAEQRKWLLKIEEYANHVKAIALQEFKDEVIKQIDHAKDNFPGHSFDPEFTRGITKGFQMASAIVNTKPTTPK